MHHLPTIFCPLACQDLWVASSPLHAVSDRPSFSFSPTQHDFGFVHRFLLYTLSVSITRALIITIKSHDR